MSQLNVDIIKNRLGTGGPTLEELTVTNNATIAGIITATTFVGDGSNLSGLFNSSTDSINTSGIITASAFFGDGSNLSGIAAGGGGDFNAGIGSATGYLVTDSMETAYTAPATEGGYIVKSIHVTNIDGENSADISGQLYGDISIANTVPVPPGSSVELLKQPKVLSQSETIELEASASNSLHATITIEPKEGDTSYVGVGTDITAAATYTDLWVATGDAVLQSILLANDDGTADVKARVVWTDESDNIQGYYAYDLTIPADATVEILEQPKYLPSGFKVRVYANQADRLEAILAAKTI